MDYIKIESHGDKVKLELNGKAEDLINILTSSIAKNPEFELMILAALTIVASMDDKNELTNNINLN